MTALGVSIGSVGALQVALKIQDVSLELLLNPQSLNLALRLSLQSHLHSLDALGHVLLGGQELLVLLGNSLLNLLPDLGQLQLASQDLVLLLLQGSLSLGQSSLKLHLLSLEPLANFVNLMDGASSLGDLVHDVLDLMGQGLVLTSDLLKLKDRLVIGILDSEEFSGDIAGLLLSGIKIKRKSINLLLPFSNNSVKLLGLLLHGRVHNLGLVQLGGHLVQVRLELGLGSINLHQLGIELLHSGLALRQTSLELES